MVIEIGLYSGILFGMRTFEPTEANPVWELQLYIPLLYIAFMSAPINQD
tara:strand:- start:1335 stop:1481 length:147 start_codon:yes stop_codon:yes gene_type:complete